MKTTRKRRALCWLGWHRWQFKDVREDNGVEVVTWGWCKNPECHRYSRPRMMGVDYLFKSADHVARRPRG
jgi:hypothetical protein